MVRLRSLTILASLLASLLGASVVSAGAARAAERDRDRDRNEGDDNPPPPSSDPGMKRVRSVALPGQPSRPPIPHTEKQTQADPRPVVVQGNGVLSSEAGFGVVRKPDGREYTTTQYPPRLIQLNGVDISAVRGETLENVTVRIDDAGNLELRAPHYDVGTDTSFHPLLPTELPRVPKGRTAPLDLPQGSFSKGSYSNGSAGVNSRKAKTGADEVPVLRSSAPPAAPSVEILQEIEEGAPRERTEERGRPLRVRTEAEDVPEGGRAGPKAVPAR